MTWHAAEADAATTARIKEEYGQIAAHLGDAAPDPDEPVTVSISADDLIRYTTAYAVYALDAGIAVVYRPLLGGAEDCAFWRDGHKVRHQFNPPPNECN
jgi:hypothetical protein